MSDVLPTGLDANSSQSKKKRNRKSSTPSFVLTLPMHVEVWQQHLLEKQFRVARHMYNDCLGEALKRVRKMKSDARYQHWIAELKSEERRDWLSAIRLEHGVTEYQLHEYIAISKKIYEPHIDINTAQKIASRVWQAISEYLFRNGNHVHFKNVHQFDSVEGKNNKSGIRYRDGAIKWNDLSMNVIVRPRDVYAKKALTHRVKYVRIVREIVNSKIRFYAQLVLEGVPPVKMKKGQLIATLGKGDVGIDIGTSTIATVGECSAQLTELAAGLEKNGREIYLFQRKLNRSRKAMNPDNYDADGRIKKGCKTWVKSKRYVKDQMQLAHMQRLQRVKRKHSHCILVNELVSYGDRFFVERMSFKGLAKRAKNTTVNSKTGKFNRKKRFGKTIGSKAPAMLVRLLKQKVLRLGGSFQEINTTAAKASQYNHISKTYVKKKLHERWTELDSQTRMQRDLYSAFLIQHTQDDLETFDQVQLEMNFPRFQQLHDKVIEGIRKNPHRISSMGI